MSVMKQKLFGLMTVMCVLLSLSAQAETAPSKKPKAAVSQDTAMQRLDEFIKASSSLQAEFEQRVSDGQGRLIETSSGTFSIRRPDQFRWDYRLPHAQTIVADGRLLWLYDPDLEQVTVKLQAQSLGGTPASLLAGDANLRDRFKVSKVEKVGTIDWLTLTPKNNDADFKKLRLALIGNQLHAIELVDKLGQFTKLEFNNVKRDVAFDSNQFVFTPPPNADVIGSELINGTQASQ
jgi:outer membrane lipoprotein carrier protein